MLTLFEMIICVQHSSPRNVSIFEVTYIDGVFLRSFKCGLLSFLKQVPKSKTDPDGNIKIKNLSNKKLDY